MSLRTAVPPAVELPPAPTLPGITPPPPSEYYLQDRDYREHNEVDRGAVSRAHSRHVQWLNSHSLAAEAAQQWLAETGRLGPEAQQALAAYRAQSRLSAQAKADVAAAALRLAHAQAALDAAIETARTDGGRLPSGRAILDAELDQKAAEGVAAAVDASGPGALRRWGNAIARADWAEALRQLDERDDGGDVLIWLRSRVTSPVGPDVDPLAWC